MKRKSIHPMEWKVSFYRMNAFYISLLTMKSSIVFGTVYSQEEEFHLRWPSETGVKTPFFSQGNVHSSFTLPSLRKWRPGESHSAGVLALFRSNLLSRKSSVWEESRAKARQGERHFLNVHYEKEIKNKNKSDPEILWTSD
jgi:hypothetical protein